MTKLDHELKTTKQDRDLWKTRYINRSLRGITARSLGEITTIKRAVIERDKWQHRYESEVDSNLLIKRQSAGRTPHQAMMQEIILLQEIKFCMTKRHKIITTNRYLRHTLICHLQHNHQTVYETSQICLLTVIVYRDIAHLRYLML